jgi:hypothetical protein
VDIYVDDLYKQKKKKEKEKKRKENQTKRKRKEREKEKEYLFCLFIFERDSPNIKNTKTTSPFFVVPIIELRLFFVLGKNKGDENVHIIKYIHNSLLNHISISTFYFLNLSLSFFLQKKKVSKRNERRTYTLYTPCTHERVLFRFESPYFFYFEAKK